MENKMSEFDFLVKHEGHVACIDLNRPHEGNTLTRAMMTRLAQCITQLSADPSTHVVVIEARGDLFCGGRDGSGENRVGMSAYDIRHQLMGAVLGVYKAIAQSPVPVIAMVQGDAVGFGAAMAVACDVTLASSRARFSFPEIEHNIPPTMAICAAMGKVPSKALSFLIYSAESVGADQAVNLGLASKILEREHFHQHAHEFAQLMSSRPRVVLETIKLYQSKAAQLSPDMASEYAGTLLALVRS
jgi:enoyl-CoA hydratase/carnithine racemase